MATNRRSNLIHDTLGEAVYTTDGCRLGRVLLTRNDELVVERDTGIRRYYVLDRGDLDRVENGVLIVRLTREQAEARKWHE